MNSGQRRNATVCDPALTRILELEAELQALHEEVAAIKAERQPAAFKVERQPASGVKSA